MSEYKYNTITDTPGAIRLLQLRPGRTKDEIHCNFLPCSLDSPNLPAFSALSYAWGEGYPADNVFLERQRMPVRRNLFTALQHFRSRKERVLLWVDALCIDQANDEERSHQVTQMKQIYQAAEKVVVWLGESSEDSDNAMDLLRIGVHDDFLPDRAVIRLTTRSWWRRAWVLQEVAVARREPEVHCGTQCIPWSCFQGEMSKVPFDSWPSFLIRIRDGRSPNNEAGELMDGTAHFEMFFALVNHLRNGGWLTWNQVFALNLTMKAADPKDLIYSMLGLVQPQEVASPLLPDYQKTNTRVRCKAVAYGIRTESRLDLLTLTGPACDSDLPSWIPNLEAGSVGIFSQSGTSFYKAAGATCPRVEWSEDYRGMTATGIVVDIVKETAAQKDTKATARCKHLAYRTGKMLDLPPATTKDRFWRTLIGNQGRVYTSQVVQYPAPSHYGHRYMAWQKEVEVPREAIGEGIEFECRLEYFKPFIASLTPFSENAKATFFTSRCGRFGIGQPGVRKGDLVCILDGGKVVLLLREHEECHTLVGCAYVHGVMDGELAHRLDDPSELRQFKIR